MARGFSTVLGKEHDKKKKIISERLIRQEETDFLFKEAITLIQVLGGKGKNEKKKKGKREFNTKRKY